jgi:hypothetical protein
MKRSRELRLSMRLRQLLLRVRRNICREGERAVAWHLKIARDFVSLNPPVPSPLGIDVSEEHFPVYLRRLPKLIIRTEKWNERCRELWASRDTDGLTAYQAAADELARGLYRFRFRLSRYERLARMPEKPILEIAQSIAEGSADPDKIGFVEEQTRMGVQDFIATEQEIDRLCRGLDRVRAKLVELFREWAILKASSMSTDPLAQVSAVAGLTKAAEMFTYGSRFRFRAYAEPWVEKYIREKRG